MNVLIINDNAQINGGAAKLAIVNARDLANRGHNVFFLCAVLPVCPELMSHPRIKVFCSEQFEILTDPNRARAFAQGWWNPTAGKLAEKLLASLDAKDTIIHLHTWAKALSSSVMKAAYLAGFPIVCTLHDFILACPTGTLFNHLNQSICQLAPMSFPCVRSNCDTRNYGHKLWRVGRQAIQKRVGLLPCGVSAFIAHSQLVSRIMKPYLPVGAHIHHLPAYIESTQEPPASTAEQRDFVYMGRLVREKGVVMLARAAKTEGIALKFVGSGPLAGEIAVENADARITGWVTRGEGVQHLRQCRALVFPSIWYETLGLVVLEAASQGVASIVPDISAASEFVVDGVTGLYFRNGDEQDLRKQLRRLRDDPELAGRLGHAAYHRFWESEYHSRTIYCDSLESIYLSTIRHKRSASHEATTAKPREELHDVRI